jgi:oxaloacetate decarboxylase gamma subunit
MEPSIGELVVSGVQLMFIGMGIVYMFLALLVWVIGMTSKLLHRYSPEPPAHLPSPATPQGAGTEGDAELVAVIAAAIRRHRNS